MKTPFEFMEETSNLVFDSIMALGKKEEKKEEVKKVDDWFATQHPFIGNNIPHGYDSEGNII